MNKDEILKKLDSLPLKKKDYIIIGDSALVLQGIIEKTDNIWLSCSQEIYDHIDWTEEKADLFHHLKCNNYIKIIPHQFEKNNILKRENYSVLNIETCYEVKRLANKKEDKKLLEKLDLLLSELDNTRYENKLRQKGLKLIAGVDEVGRGPLVGPVVAACVILPEKFNLPGLTDSKKLSEKKRNILFEEIKKQALAIGIGIVDEKTIDEVNIYEATKMAMKEAIKNCPSKPEHILIDAMPLNIEIPTTSLIKGDLKSITISAASVIAKVTRDRMLYELDQKYPMYDFKGNKGYPTKRHIEAIEKYGIIKEHRRSYEPVRKYLNNHAKSKI